jgi:putative two-component system response regulator
MDKAERVSGSVLIVDDMPDNLALIAGILNEYGLKVRLATSGKTALASAKASPPEMMLLDINMPEMDGYEVCARFKEDPLLSSIPIIFLTAQNESSDVVKAFAMGAADFVTKPFRREELVARVTAHMKIRILQEELKRHNEKLASMVDEKVAEIKESQMATIKVLASQAEYRDNETGQHIKRVQEFCRLLGKETVALPEFSRIALKSHQSADAWVNTLYFASVLHDIGKVGIKDEILLKPTSLTPDESEIMKRHTIIGAANMEEARRSYPNNAFINMGIEIARSHHERWDGGGYPDGMAGDDIPLSARIMNLADQYDALRSERPYKKAFDHPTVYRIITVGDGRTAPDHFDARILDAFKRAAGEFERIYDSLRG